MSVHRDNLNEIVNAAWTRAIQRPRGDDGQLSRAWVDALARQFQNNYALDHHRVFWRGNKTNKRHFGLNELLFDITVCSVSTTESLQHPPTPLEFVSECHWQVESELNIKDTRKVVVDMSKLVLGNAENKLLVAGHRSRHDDILKQRAKIARCCPGNLFLLFISHPCKWSAPERPQLYEWSNEMWQSLGQEQR